MKFKSEKCKDNYNKSLKKSTSTIKYSQILDQRNRNPTLPSPTWNEGLKLLYDKTRFMITFYFFVILCWLSNFILFFVVLYNRCIILKPDLIRITNNKWSLIDR